MTKTNPETSKDDEQATVAALADLGPRDRELVRQTVARVVAGGASIVGMTGFRREISGWSDNMAFRSFYLRVRAASSRWNTSPSEVAVAG